MIDGEQWRGCGNEMAGEEYGNGVNGASAPSGRALNFQAKKHGCGKIKPNDSINRTISRSKKIHKLRMLAVDWLLAEKSCWLIPTPIEPL